LAARLCPDPLGGGELTALQSPTADPIAGCGSPERKRVEGRGKKDSIERKEEKGERERENLGKIV